jgi:hypothetical protein
LATKHGYVNVVVWFDRLSSPYPDKSWLIVFDNVEDEGAIAKYWPVSQKGAILMTTRKPMFGMHSANSGLPIKPLEDISGAEFVLHLLGITDATDETWQTHEL